MLNILKIIILAIISAAFAVIAEQAVAAIASIFWNQEVVLDLYTHFTWFLALAAILEEASKFWAVYFVLKKRLGLESIGFVFGALLLGLTWGIFEIGLILFTNQDLITVLKTANSKLIFSFASMLVLHTITAFAMGIFIFSNIFSARLQILKILFFPILIHLLFNFLIIQRGGFTNYLIVIILALFFIIESTILLSNVKRLA